MARKVRIEYAGAVYHVMSRGDRREPIFFDDKDREMFLATLAEMCERTGALVHSYVLMNNHYHLLLETPEGNLVAGMKWFQGTYTQRFNACHLLKGHLFQGRYKAIPVEAESGEYFMTVSDYIHLNPVRAGMVNVGKGGLEEYRWSSFPEFVKKHELPEWLKRKWIFERLGLPDEGHGSRRRYGALMRARTREMTGEAATGEEAQKWKGMRQRWCLGSDGFGEKLMDKVGKIIAGRKRGSYRGAELRRHDEKEAEKILTNGLRILGLKAEVMELAKKSDPRKQGLAWLVKSRTIVGDEWICKRLNMGHPSNVSRAVAAYRALIDPKRKRLKRKLHVCRD